MLCVEEGTREALLGTGARRFMGKTRTPPPLAHAPYPAAMNPR